MQLTVREVSKLLNVSEGTIYRWIQQGVIPAYRIFDQYRFNRAELLEWAQSRKIKVSPDIFQDSESKSVALPHLWEALAAGGIYYSIEGSDKEAVLRSVIKTLRFPGEIDRKFLLQVLLAREELGSTGIGEGIALPHVRNPIILNVSYSMIALCFLEKPVDFGAYDQQPVHCLFTIISSTVREHLHLLSKLAFCLKDQTFKQMILRHASSEEILNELKRVESNLKPAGHGDSENKG